MNDERQMMTVRSLLAQLAVIAKKNREALEKSEWNFNVFRLCGVYHYENANSRILAEFLNPHGSHGLGSALLEHFLSALEIPFSVSEMTEVVTELAMEKGRMDIVIRDRACDWCVVIENKIFAAEQDEQLPRYWNWLMTNYQEDNSRLLFLTLSGYGSETAETAKKSGQRIVYSPVSYSHDIVHWLDECISLAVERPFARETLRQYRNHIKNLTGKSMEKENMKEVIDLMASADNFEAAQIVHDHYEEACHRIAAGIFDDVAHGLAGVCEVAPGAEAPKLNGPVEEGYKFVEPRTGVIIRIAPEKKGYDKFFVGVTNADAKDCGEVLRNVMDNSWKKNQWWPSYKYLPDGFQWWSGELLLRCLREKTYRAQLVDSIASLVKELCAVLNAH